jgi:hypothetical protein
MYVVTSFLYFTTQTVLHVRCHLFFMFHYTQSCTSCTLSPLFHISLHRAVLHVHCLQLCVVKYKNEVTMYMKYSFVVKHKKEVTMYMKYSCVLWNIKKHLFFMFHYKAVLHVHCHFVFIFHCTELSFMYVVTSFLYFTTQTVLHVRWQCTWSTAVCSEI